MSRWKNWLPSREEISRYKWLRSVSHRLHEAHLWSFDQTHVVKGVMIGIFMCMMPFPFQMIPAGFLAIYFRANIIMACSLCWISNPFTMLPMMYGAYLFGCYLYGITPIFHETDMGWREVVLNTHQIFIPLITGCVIIGTISASLMGAVVWLFYRFKYHRIDNRQGHQKTDKE